MKTSMTWFVLTASFVGAMHTALAVDAASTRRGDQYYLALAKTDNMHAHDHVRMLGKYAAASDAPVPSAVIKEHVAEIRKNAAAARKSFSRMSASAKNNPVVSKELSEINGRLSKVDALVEQLEAQTKQDTAEAKAVASTTDAMAQELKATHLASKVIDQAIQQDTEDDQFNNPQSPDYFFTGEGHFLD